MKPLLRKRAPKNLPTAVSDLVAEGGNVLASDDATVLTVAPAKTPEASATPSAKPRPSRAKQRVASPA
jgi:hypothetical protein